MDFIKKGIDANEAREKAKGSYGRFAGLGHFLHTYVCDGNPVIPTFQGEPERVAIDGTIDQFTEMLWQNLNENNKISLFVRFTDIETGAFEQRIINKHQ